MAPFLSRLFGIQKRITNNIRQVEQQKESKRIKPPEFDSGKQIRILLFRELNGQERRLLFDSKAVRKRDPSTPGTAKPDISPSFLTVRGSKESSIEKSFKLNDVQSREYLYEWQKSSSDEEMLREMIFGSVSISYQGTTLKVHTIRSPAQVMISVVFSAPVAMFRIGGQELDESGNWNNSTSEISISRQIDRSETHLAHSVPVNVPSRLSGHYVESRDSDSDSLQSHDGYSSLPATYLSPEVSSATRLPRSSSYNSLQRRLLRNKATSIEMGLQGPDYILPTEEVSRSAGQKKAKLGLSIVVNLNENNKREEKQFNDFLFTHMSLIESHVLNLKETVVRAYLNRRNFVHIMFEGCKKFQRAISDLYTAPRLQNPEWLTIISSPNHRHLSYAFLEKFTSLLKCFDKKETNFFVSTLLTAVLTHHLAWVPSVIPTDSKIHSTQTSHKHTPLWVDLLSKSRPYNPHWVQLGDLYGALGFPVKLSKTVIKGQKKEVVLKFLQVLSYFIRCSDICEQVYEKTSNSGSDGDELLTGQLPSDKYGSSSEVSSIGSKVDSKLSTSTSDSNASIKLSALPCLSELPPTSNHCCFDHVTTWSNSSCNFSVGAKDLSDVTVTHSGTLSSNKSLHEVTSSVQVPVCSNTHSVPAESCHSLGYASLEERTNTDSVITKHALQENKDNSQRSDILTICDDSLDINHKRTHCGKENNPLISVTPWNDICDSKNNSVTFKNQKHSAKCEPCLCENSSCNVIESELCPYDGNLKSSSCKLAECESGLCNHKLSCTKDSPSKDFSCSVSVSESCLCDGKAKPPAMKSSNNSSSKVEEHESFPLESVPSSTMKSSSSDSSCEVKECEHSPCDGNLKSSSSSDHSSCKAKECESAGEEGYHSMEEPHSPSQERLHLSDMLKRFDNWCPEGMKEIALPGVRCCGENADSSVYKSFGWSLMAGVTNHYLKDFCLQGLQGSLNEEEVRQDLIQSSQIHVLGDPISEAVCIVADTDKWNVHILSSNYTGGEKPHSMGVTVAMSSLVSGICDAVLNMKELGIPPESCIIYLEDRLQELYFRSQMLSDYLRHNRSQAPLSKVASMLSVDISDMPLLLSVATTHSPYLNVHNR